MSKVTDMQGEPVDGSEPEQAEAPGPEEGEIENEEIFDFEAAVQYALRIEDVQEKIDKIDEEAATRAAPHREKIAELYKEAAGNDVTRKVLKYVVSKRRQDRRRRRSFANLKQVHQQQTEQLEMDLETAEAGAEAA